jgi:hypothetical protein
MQSPITRRRSFTRLNADAKANCLVTAEFATRTWRRHSNTEGSARCTLCGQRIYTVRRRIESELESWGNALVGAMVAHLEDDCAVSRRSTAPQALAVVAEDRQAPGPRSRAAGSSGRRRSV